MPVWLAVYGVLVLAAAGLAGVLSGIKNRDVSYWMGWCFLFPPAVILLAVLPRHMGPRPRQRRLDEHDHEED